MTFTWSVNPVILVLANTAVRYYSLLFSLALIAGYVLLRWQFQRARLPVEEVGEYSAYGNFSLIIGARLGHALFYDFDRVLTDPVWLLRIENGGFASHGGVAGLAIAMHLFTKRRNIDFLEGTDRLTFSVAFGSILFRLGNLFNSEIVGKPTEGAWGVRFPLYDRSAIEAPLRHPTQIYEMVLGIIVCLVLLAADRAWGKENRPRGALTGLFLLVYCAGRILVECLKENETPNISTQFTMGQILSVPCLLLGAWLLAVNLRNRKSNNWAVAAG